MKARYLLTIAASGAMVLIVVTQFVAAQSRPPAPPLTVALSPLMEGGYLLAAPGRVESASEEIALGAPLNGMLKQVLVKEGDAIKQGQVLASLDTDPYQAELDKAEGALHLRQTELQRVENGARQQERDASRAALQETEAVVKNAAVELERRRALLESGYTARGDYDRADRDYSVAVQQRDAAKQRFSLINDHARDEDVAIAQAQVEIAKADRDKAQADLNQAVIRSPIDGVVLRVNRRPGEVMSIFLDPTVLTVGDIAHLNVRADVDEADIGKLQPGMPAYVTAEAFGDERFAGRVTRIGKMLGRKNMHTDEPKERSDAKILEVIISLDDGGRLPPGLRVNAFMGAPQVSENIKSNPETAAK